MKQNFFLLASVLLSMLITAQEGPSKIKVYTPSGSSSSAAAKSNSYKWCVKTDFFAVAVGEFPIIGEMRIAPKFSVEASAGVTYAFLTNANLFSMNDENNDTFGYESTKAAMGTAFRAAIKYYPSSDYDAIEGWSFGIQVFRKVTNRDYLTNNGSEYDLEGKQDSKTKTGISLVIGKQIFQDSNITFESFIGLGMANITRDYYTQGVYDETTFSYGVEQLSTKETVPNFSLGMRIGFGN